MQVLARSLGTEEAQWCALRVLARVLPRLEDTVHARVEALVKLTCENTIIVMLKSSPMQRGRRRLIFNEVKVLCGTGDMSWDGKNKKLQDIS